MMVIYSANFNSALCLYQTLVLIGDIEFARWVGSVFLNCLDIAVMESPVLPQRIGLSQREGDLSPGLPEHVVGGD